MAHSLAYPRRHLLSPGGCGQAGLEIGLVPVDLAAALIPRSRYTLTLTAANIYLRPLTNLIITLTSTGSSSFLNVTSSTLPSGFTLSTTAPWRLTAPSLAASTTVKLNLTFTVGSVGDLTIQATTSALRDGEPAIIREAVTASPALNVVSRRIPSPNCQCPPA